MIATVFFPRFSSALFHLSDPLITHFDMSVAPFAFSRLRVFTGRNDRFNRGGVVGWRIGQEAMDRPPIIGPIAVAPGHRRVDLRQQGLELPRIIPIGCRHLLGNDFLAIGVDAQMRFAPRPARRGAMLPGRPFALAIDFQPGRIDHQIDRIVRRPHGQRHRQVGLTTVDKSGSDLCWADGHGYIPSVGFDSVDESRFESE